MHPLSQRVPRSSKRGVAGTPLNHSNLSKDFQDGLVVAMVRGFRSHRRREPVKGGLVCHFPAAPAEYRRSFMRQGSSASPKRRICAGKVQERGSLGSLRTGCRKIGLTACRRLLSSIQCWCRASRPTRSGVTDAFLLIQYGSPPSPDQRGATAVEYGIMVSLIAVVIIVAVTLLGGTAERHLRPNVQCEHSRHGTRIC